MRSGSSGGEPNRAASSSRSASITFSRASSSGCALADRTPDPGDACDHPAAAVACVFVDDRPSQQLAHRIRHRTFGGAGLVAGKRLSRRDLASRAVVVRQIGLIPPHADTARDDPLRKSRRGRRVAVADRIMRRSPRLWAPLGLLDESSLVARFITLKSSLSWARSRPTGNTAGHTPSARSCRVTFRLSLHAVAMAIHVAAPASYTRARASRSAAVTTSRSRSRHSWTRSAGQRAARMRTEGLRPRPAPRRAAPRPRSPSLPTPPRGDSGCLSGDPAPFRRPEL